MIHDAKEVLRFLQNIFFRNAVIDKMSDEDVRSKEYQEEVEFFSDSEIDALDAADDLRKEADFRLSGRMS